MIFFYNLWIVLTSVTALSAVILACYFLRLRARLWRLLAAVLFGIFLDCAHSALLLGLGTSPHCRATSMTVILSRMLIRLLQAGSIVGLKLYVYGYFKEKRNSKDYPEADNDNSPPSPTPPQEGAP